MILCSVVVVPYEFVPGPNKPKRKKVGIRFESVPVVTNPDELVGKRVEHLTFDYEGKDKWYKVTVMRIMPNTESELVISMIVNTPSTVLLIPILKMSLLNCFICHLQIS